MFVEAAKHTMLNALTADRVQLHSGDPGAAGTNNVVATTYVAATFSAASGGERVLASDVAFTGLTANQTITHMTVWNHNGGTAILHGSKAITGDQAANASGEYTLKATTTKLALSDPA